MEPVSDDEQSCHSFHLAVSPPTEHVPLSRRLRQPRASFQLCWRRISRCASWPRSVVETHRRPRGPRPRARRASRSSAPTLPIWTCSTSCSFRGPVRADPAPRTRARRARAGPGATPSRASCCDVARLHPRALRVRPRRHATPARRSTTCCATGQGRVPGLRPPDDRRAALASACRPAT